MSNQIVRNWMTPNPITITLQTTLPEARQLMNKYHIRRLPVLNKGKLVGIVTRGDLKAAQASNATTLSVYELNYLLDKGGFVAKADGTFAVDFTKIKGAVRDLVS